MSLLAVRNVSKRFGGVNALADVTFAVEPGDVLGIIGPNGAGKTTLLNCVSGVVHPDTGDLRWEETSISRVPPYRRARLGIGRTFQIVRPFPSMTVRENTAMGALFGQPSGRLQPAAAIKQADAVLELVGLGEKRDYPVLRLTVPDRKRLEVARALGPRLWGVRLDTSESLVDRSLWSELGDFKPTGVNERLVRKVRDALDRDGFERIKIVVSGGFTVEKIREFEERAVPVDSYGVGSSLIRGSNDFTADVVLTDGRPSAKAGRRFRPNPRFEVVE